MKTLRIPTGSRCVAKVGPAKALYRVFSVTPDPHHPGLYEVRGEALADGELGIWHWDAAQATAAGWRA